MEERERWMDVVKEDDYEQEDSCEEPDEIEEDDELIEEIDGASISFIFSFCLIYINALKMTLYFYI